MSNTASKQLVEVDEEEKSEIKPYEGEGRRSLVVDKDQHLLDSNANNPSSMGNTFFQLFPLNHHID